jgi:SAM-dependent methyltransferase
MTQNPAAADWAAARGDKWSGQLAGLEATLAAVDEPLIEALRLEAPARIADVGCGGGGTTLEILRRAPAGSVVHGFDISPANIDSARARIPAGERAIAFTVADVAIVAPPSEPYDRLVSRFGVMFYDDPPSAFANLARWLTPGGRFAFAVWAPPADNPWMTIVRDAVAEVVDVPRPDPDAPGPFRYADARTLLALLDNAGFEDLDVRDWRGALPIGGGMPAADAALFGLTAFSSFGELLAEAGEAATARARESLTARLSRHEQRGAVRIAACVHIVTGVRRER